MARVKFWNVPKIWNGSRCVIIGGGPSISKVFDIPNSVVKAVQKKELPISVYGDYMTQIHREKVIGVNAAYKIGNFVDMLYFGDRSYWRRDMGGILNFQGLRITSSKNIEQAFQSKIKIIKRNDQKKLGINQTNDMISWNKHSGGAAINLAYLLGAKKIILLGFDMDAQINEQHWHNEYSIERKRYKAVYNNHLKSFPFIASDANLLGVEIINCSPGTKIKEFTVKERIEECLE